MHGGAGDATAPLRAGQRLGTAEMVLFYGHFVAVAVWLRLTGAVLGRFADGPGEVLRTTPLVLWRIGVAATIGAAVALPHADLFDEGRFGARLRWMEPVLAARLAPAVLLLPGAVVTLFPDPPAGVEDGGLDALDDRDALTAVVPD